MGLVVGWGWIWTVSGCCWWSNKTAKDQRWCSAVVSLALSEGWHDCGGMEPGSWRWEHRGDGLVRNFEDVKSFLMMYFGIKNLLCDLISLRRTGSTVSRDRGKLRATTDDRIVLD